MAGTSRQDIEHLDLLGIFHYVVAGLAACFGCFPVFHLAMGLAMLFAPEAIFHEEAADFPFRLFGLVFAVIPALIMAFAFAFAILLAVAGRRLRARTHYLFCQVAAGVACMFVPFGTVLGVFTLIVLARPGVRALFGVPLPEERVG